MYINVAYLKDMLESYLTPVDYADTTVPLKILCCGFYRVMQNDDTVYTFRPMGRKDYQLLYFHSGQGHFSLKDDEADTLVTAGQIVIFHPGERQVYEYHASDHTEVYWIHFTGSEAEKYLSDNGFIKTQQIFWSGTSIEYQELCRKMIKELQLCKAGYEEILTLLFRELLLLIKRNKSNSHISQTAIEEEINMALLYFNENYTSEIKIEEYAASRFLSPSWFIRSFRQYTGTTPRQYIISVRMTNARELLLNPLYSVTDVASLVGYDDPLYFSRLFKQYVGVTPKDYRKAAKKLSML